MTRGAHLAEHELIDALDGALSGDRAAHLAACATCAAQIADLRAIAARAAAVDVPEPPAFFWSQLSARVRSAVAEEATARPRVAAWRGWWRPAAALATAAGVVVLVAALAGGWPDRGASQPAPAVALHTVDDLPVADHDGVDIDQDEAWAIVRTLAEDLDHDEMDGEGVSAGPGSIDRLTLGLSEPERIELARLLEEQLKGRRIPESAS